jgi:hypothetical protein
MLSSWSRNDSRILYKLGNILTLLAAPQIFQTFANVAIIANKQIAINNDFFAASQLCFYGM